MSNEPKNDETAMSPYQQHAVALRDNMTFGTPGAIVPHTFSEAHSFAAALAASSIIHADLKNKPSDVLMMILSGAELGLAPMASLRSFHVIKGVARMSARALVAACIASPHCEKFEMVEMSSTKSVWCAKRKGQGEKINTWVIDDAQRAGLLGNDNWKKYPKAMLNARCSSELAGIVFPEIVLGIRISESAGEDEFDRIDDADFVSVPLPTPPAPPTPSANGAAKKAAPKPPAIVDAKSEEKPLANGTPVMGTPATPAQNQAAADNAFAKAAEATRAADAARKAKADEDQRAREAFDREEQARAAAQPSLPIAPVVAATADASPATVPVGDDFGEETPSAPAIEFDRFLAELGACTKQTLDDIKKKWAPWSKVGQPGNEFAPRMREAFEKRKADLGI